MRRKLMMGPLHFFFWGIVEPHCEAKNAHEEKIQQRKG
jgi:hypothetical protein